MLYKGGTRSIKSRYNRACSSRGVSNWSLSSVFKTLLYAPRYKCEEIKNMLIIGTVSSNWRHVGTYMPPTWFILLFISSVRRQRTARHKKILTDQNDQAERRSTTMINSAQNWTEHATCRAAYSFYTTRISVRT